MTKLVMLNFPPRSSSGVGGGASGASADAPTVGHRWQSNTIVKKKKRKVKENEKRKKQMGLKKNVLRGKKEQGQVKANKCALLD